LRVLAACGEERFCCRWFSAHVLGERNALRKWTSRAHWLLNQLSFLADAWRTLCREDAQRR